MEVGRPRVGKANATTEGYNWLAKTIVIVYSATKRQYGPASNDRVERTRIQDRCRDRARQYVRSGEGRRWIDPTSAKGATGQPSLKEAKRYTKGRAK